MNTASDRSLRRKAAPTRAHARRRSRPPRARGLHVPGANTRQERARHLGSRSATEAPRSEPVLVGDIGEADHEYAIESPMPAVSSPGARSLHSALTLPIASLVACIYIGVPLALFTHEFSNHRLLATLVAAALVFAAAFGGVLRVLRTTTSHAVGVSVRGVATDEIDGRAGAGLVARGGEARDFRQLAEA